MTRQQSSYNGNIYGMTFHPGLGLAEQGHTSKVRDISGSSDDSKTDSSWSNPWNSHWPA